MSRRRKINTVSGKRKKQFGPGCADLFEVYAGLCKEGWL